MRLVVGRLLPALLATILLVGADQVAPTPTSLRSPGASLGPSTSYDVALRMEILGGLAGDDILLEQVPPFTLYADGTVVYRSQDGTPEPPLHMTRLSDDDMSQLLRSALDEFGLREARASARRPAVADAVSIVFTVDVEGVRKRVSVDATVPNEPSASADPLLELARTLGAFERYLPEDAVTEPYHPPAYRAVFNEHERGGATPRAWPWTDVTMADLRPVPDSPAISTIDLRPDQVAPLDDTASGDLTGILVEAPDGRTFLVSMRPLLPDEIEPAR